MGTFGVFGKVDGRLIEFVSDEEYSEYLKGTEEAKCLVAEKQDCTAVSASYIPNFASSGKNH